VVTVTCYETQRPDAIACGGRSARLPARMQAFEGGMAAKTSAVPNRYASQEASPDPATAPRAITQRVLTHQTAEGHRGLHPRFTTSCLVVSIRGEAGHPASPRAADVCAGGGLRSRSRSVSTPRAVAPRVDVSAAWKTGGIGDGTGAETVQRALPQGGAP